MDLPRENQLLLIGPQLVSCRLKTLTKSATKNNTTYSKILTKHNQSNKDLTKHNNKYIHIIECFLAVELTVFFISAYAHSSIHTYIL